MDDETIYNLKLGNPFQGKLLDIEVKKPPTSKRAFWVEMYCEFFGDKNFGKMLGRTKHLKPEKMHELYDKATTWRKNRDLMPLNARQALLNKLIKENKIVWMKN